MNARIEQVTPTTLTRGFRIGHYLLRRHLQQGGMSSVYLAYDEYTYTTVAIKIIDVQSDACGTLPTKSERLAQFRHEVQMMKCLARLYPLARQNEIGRVGFSHI